MLSFDRLSKVAPDGGQVILIGSFNPPERALRYDLVELSLML